MLEAKLRKLILENEGDRDDIYSDVLNLINPPYDLLRRMATHKGDDLGLFAHEAAQIVKEIDNNQ